MIAALLLATVSPMFTICDHRPRINCVVDGDTFWMGGAKIRIADIDTPEINQPKCRAEWERGQRAKLRLLQMLNGGKVRLSAYGRDRDRNGRLLRAVSAGGRPVGATLIHEGLARRWDGQRRSWC